MGAFRAEWRKLVHARSVQVSLGAVVILILALCWQGTLNAASGVNDPGLATPRGAGTLALAVYSVLLAPIMGALIGARIGAQDFADGTAGTAIVAMGRVRYAVGKLGGLLVAAVLCSTVVGVAGAVFGAAAQQGWSGLAAAMDLVVPLAFAMLCTTLGALLAFVLASSIRSVKAAVAILVGLFLGPSALPSDLGMWVARLQPYYVVTQIFPNAFYELRNALIFRPRAVTELDAASSVLVVVAVLVVYIGSAIVIWQRREVNA